MQTHTPHSSNLDQARTAINALQEKATETCKALRKENLKQDEAGKIYQSFLDWLFDWRNTYEKNNPNYPITKPPKTESQFGLFGEVQITALFAARAIDIVASRIYDDFKDKYERPRPNRIG
jgi:hypothetical protein